MNKKQKLIFRKLAEIFSNHDLDDIKVALDAFRNEELLGQFSDSAIRADRNTKRVTQSPSRKTRQQPRERLREVDREVSEEGSEEQAYALRVAKKILDRETFSGAPLIREMFNNLGIDVAKSVSDRSQLVITLYSHLENQTIQKIQDVEQVLDGYGSQKSSLADWSRVINRRNEDE